MQAFLCVLRRKAFVRFIGGGKLPVCATADLCGQRILAMRETCVCFGGCVNKLLKHCDGADAVLTNF